MLHGRQGACGARHILPVERRPADERLPEQVAVAARQTLEKMAEAPGRPGAMAAFDDLFAAAWRREAIEADERKVVGYLCNFVPDELVLAAGAIPLRLDLGHGASAEAGGRLLAADVCPEVKSLMGAHLGELPYMRHADLLVVPTACDGKKKLAWMLGEQREVWLMELPQTREGTASRQLWLEEIKALARRLEQLTGRRIRRRALREAVELVNRRSRLARRINELRFEDPRRLNGRDAFLVMQATFIADPGWWVERAGALVKEMEAAKPSGDQPARVLLTGSPVLFPDFQLLQLTEESGAAVVVADEMCSGTQRLHNLTVLDETTVGGMMRAAAEKTLMPCTCPCFVGGDLRVDRVLELASQSGARGVIHHTLRLCQLYDLEAPRLAEALRQRGLPMLSLHAEYGGEGAATLRNRVEAFIEMLQQ
jgi:benzoyl-CoA reductase/2-hydroxyglutaryl-CoA dehydratase subunit BcrC/BadD/HgdB